ncbi:DUF2238 domain-containing protein [Kangiella profundi]|uniref:DUF2238 domain-containing protein n=1 Tax=Kangiella profundi TaxID=1561924 RepID=A0A2K9AWH8_9GAMM|nr:DUF2238 domain-containing protein [Kangiella profundi]AUD78259.1 DUF2238 domain-containing protein [Kangiella profundi]
MTYNTKFLLTLSGIFLVIFILCAINPIDRTTWLLENILMFLLIAGMIGSYNKFRLSRISYFCIFLFLCFHEIGSHYTYSQVPYNQWTESVFGSPLNDWFGWERNHYDRFLHFAYGLLFAYPIREIFIRVVKVKGFWGYFLPLDLTLSTSAIYELIEWAAALVFGGDVGAAYLGTQGDVWDAHKDMALAGLGALIAMVTLAFINWRWQRDFAREWNESLTPQTSNPETL